MASPVLHPAVFWPAFPTSFPTTLLLSLHHLHHHALSFGAPVLCLPKQLSLSPFHPSGSLFFLSWDCSLDPKLYLHTHIQSCNLPNLKNPKTNKKLKASADFRAVHCSFAYGTSPLLLAAPFHICFQPACSLHPQALHCRGHTAWGDTAPSVPGHWPLPHLQSCTILPLQGW